MIRYTTILVTMLSLILVGCSGGANNVAAVTALPTQDTASIPTMTTIPPEVTLSDSAQASGAPAGNVPVLATAPAIEFAGLAPGESREIAMATDMAMAPQIEAPIDFEAFPVPITFSEFYDGWDIQRGMIMSNKLMSLDGQQVVIEGYVAPPLKPRIDFFVLTRMQLAFCPFCSTDAEWPTDIAVIYMPEQDVIDTTFPVRVTGTIEIGPSTDADSGMVSMVRLYADDIQQLR